jgi:hypothetical protein
MIRAYHFLPTTHALDDLRKKRLKIAQLHDLNDPFDLWALAQPNASLRSAMRATKEHMATRFGMVCFSMSWQNPLLCSHYAERHRGVALGFDLNESNAKAVSYVPERPAFEGADLSTINQLLYTKYSDWKYEQEVRVFTSLQDKDPESGLYFADFSDNCALREVIAGPLNRLTEDELRAALGEYPIEVGFAKARLAFRSFNVVKNEKGF